MPLPRGVTGFGEEVDRSLPATDFRTFKSACYSAARRLAGAVVGIQSCEGRVTPNFHRVSLALPGGAVEVLCNARLPFVAAIRPLTGPSTLLAFVDVPGLSEVLQESGPFRLLTAQELDAAVRPEALAELALAEREQINYWKPRRVGEVIFNFWD